MNAPDPEEYGHRAIVLNAENRDAPLYLVLVDGELDAGALAECQDAIESGAHVLLAARNARTLEPAELAVVRIAALTSAVTRH